MDEVSGKLAERFESAGLGPGAVSSGAGDPGGVSYGLYQFASRTGTIARFLAVEGQPWSDALGVAAPGTPAFSAAWRATAAAAPRAFAGAQRAFVARTHYAPLAAAVRRSTGLDLATRSAALREVAWSCAVQHGAAARIVAQAIALADKDRPRAAPGYDRALIAAIYAVRSDYVRKLAGRLPESSARTLRSLAERRYPAECAMALAMLDGHSA